MNLYDLSIGEDKMNQFLSIALKTHFESLKVSGKEKIIGNVIKLFKLL